VRSGSLVVAYQDGATTRYKSLPLTGTGVTWSRGTASP